MKIFSFFPRKIFFASLIFIFVSSKTVHSQIVLSEIMFDPLGSEYYNEFIEIYNSSPTETVNLAGWKMSDSSDADLIVAYDRGLQLAPRAFAIILDPGYFENSKQYENLIPPEALILTIDDGAFGSQGLSNSRAEPIILISSSGDTVAKYRYSLNNQPGHSDEKINLSGDDAISNWSNSKDINGTPGNHNSVRQLRCDVAVELVGFPSQALAHQSIALIASITNKGQTETAHISITFFENVNADSLLSVEEQLFPATIVTDPMLSGQNLQKQVTVDSLKSGAHFFYVTANLIGDQDTSNNIASTKVKIGFPQKVLLINEIMYRPAAGQAEWIELFNPGEAPINLREWQISDAHTENRIILSTTDRFVPSQGYVVIAEDSTINQGFPEIPCEVIIPRAGFPALNNDKDLICLYDVIGTPIDQISYQSSWGSENGISLERKSPDQESNDPANWGLSQFFTGGSPGTRNSISPKNFDLRVKVAVNQIPPDSILIAATIYNDGLSPISIFTYHLYLDENLDSLCQEQELISMVSYDQTILFHRDSTVIDQTIAVIRKGLIQVIANIIFPADENTANNIAYHRFYLPFQREQIVINEIMFQPAPDHPEWIELYYPEGEPINLSGWKFSDVNTLQKHFAAEHSIWIRKGEYIILSESDAIISEIQDTTSCRVIIPKSWPSLNNTSDQIVFYDPSNQAIDSLAYFSSQCPSFAVSLERIDFTKSGSDTLNWAASIDLARSTPGRLNSVSPLDFDLAISGTTYHPANPLPGDETTISVRVINCGRHPMSDFRLTCQIDFNHDEIYQDDETIGEPISFSQILEPDKTITMLLPFTPSLSGRYMLRANLFSDADLKSANNFMTGIVSIGFKSQAVVVNEIMFAPLAQQCEWIELFNPNDAPADIEQWKLSDSDSINKSLISKNHKIIEPHAFLILAADSSVVNFYQIESSLLSTITPWPTLNNDRDQVLIFDSNNNIIDAVHYNSAWGRTQGNSLERINPNLASNDSANWNSCVAVAGATPGRQNSIYIETFPAETEMMISPNPFSPDGDGRDDFTIINYQLPFNLSQIHVKVYDIRGRLVRFLMNNRPAGINGSIIWDGRDDQGHICRMGIYIVYLEAIQTAQRKMQSFKKSVVLARPL